MSFAKVFEHISYTYLEVISVVYSLGPIIPGLVTNGTAKICCLGLILALFTALWSLKMILDDK